MNNLRERVRFLRRADIIRHTNGRWFSCEFVKANGSQRRMVARVGVHKYVNGNGLKFNPAEHDLVVVFDSAAHGYRMINLSSLLWIKCGDYVWRAEEDKGSIR